MDFFLGLCVGVVLATAFGQYLAHWERPFRWRCDKCSYEVEANDSVWIDRLITQHQESHP